MAHGNSSSSSRSVPSGQQLDTKAETKESTTVHDQSQSIKDGSSQYGSLSRPARASIVMLKALQMKRPTNSRRLSSKQKKLRVSLSTDPSLERPSITADMIMALQKDTTRKEVVLFKRDYEGG